MTESEHPASSIGDNSAGKPAIESSRSHRDAGRVTEEALLSKPVDVALSNQNIKYQEESSAEKLVEIADAWRAILRQLWNDAAKAMTKGDSRSEDALLVADEGFGDFADWLVKRVDWREAVLPRVAGNSSSGEAFEGPLELVMLKVRVGAESLQGKPLDLANFFRGAVAATLRRQEADGLASREARADLVIQPLIRLAMSGTPIFAGDRLCAFAAGVWDYLDREGQQRGEGFFTTQLNLAQWVGQWGGKAGRVRVRYYYHRLLGEGPQATGNAIVKVAANNLAGQIADDIQKRPDRYHDDDLATATRVVNRLQMLSTVARLAELDADMVANTAVAQELASGFWHALGRPRADGPTALRTAHALMSMANVVSAWNKVDWGVIVTKADANEGRSSTGEGWQATISAHAALARMVFNRADDFDEISSAFFNAGAALGRFDDGPKTARLRFAINAVGLRWALERATDADQAMAAYHGLNCAVNLLGALTEVDGVFPEAVEPLASILLGWGAQAESAEVQVDIHRIKASLSKLHVDVAQLRAIPLTPARASEALDALLAVLSPALAAPDLTKPGDPQVLAPLATELSRLFGEALGEETYRQHLNDLDALLDALARLADVPQNAWQEFYGEWHGENNPIVEAGLMTEDAWHRLERDAVRQTDSLADWLSECLRDFVPP